MPTLTATERVTQFIHDIDPTKLPSAVREQATLCLLDALGVPGRDERTERAGDRPPWRTLTGPG
jgi:hypothetical protein